MIKVNLNLVVKELGKMIVLLVWLVMAYICYITASEKGLNSALWGILGILFGFFALMVLVMIPSKKER